MNFENVSKKESELLLKSKILAEYAFNYSTDPKERYNEILKKMVGFIEEDEKNSLGTETVIGMKENIRKCCDLQEKDEFMECFLLAIKPIFDYEKDYPRNFESVLGYNMTKRYNFLPLNQVFSYGKDGNIVHIHISPATSMSPSEKLSNLKNGLKELAKIIEQDEEVETITATSSLVAEHPEIVEGLLGFAIDGPISKEERENHFKYDTREIHKAHMTREDFLKKWKK